VEMLFLLLLMVSVSRLTEISDDKLRYKQQQRNGAVEANRVAGSVHEPKSLMKKEGDQMNQHVRKTKGVTADHPVPVLVDPFPFDVDKRHDGEEQP